MTAKNKSAMVDISEITEYYLPVSKRKARKFVLMYLEPKRIGNRIYVERDKLEQLLRDPGKERFPLKQPDGMHE